MVKSNSTSSNHQAEPIKKGRKTVRRGPNGRFLPGSAGGPGRPRGSRNRIHRLTQDLLDASAEDLVGAVIQKGLNGDVAAMRLCLERIIPPTKSPPCELAPEDMRLTEMIRLAIGKVASGELSVEQGKTIALLAERLFELDEVETLSKRLDELEKQACEEQ